MAMKVSASGTPAQHWSLAISWVELLSTIQLDFKRRSILLLAAHAFCRLLERTQLIGATGRRILRREEERFPRSINLRSISPCCSVTAASASCSEIF